MYKSPIELIYQGTEMQIERGILRAVHKQDINVDREELIRALQYDREQYEKGYQDGLAAAPCTGQWVNAAGCRTICNNCGEYPLYDYFGRQKFSRHCPSCGAIMNGGEDNGGE